MRAVLKNLIDGLSEAWIRVGRYWKAPCKSAITQARQRLGPRVMSQLFHQLVRPMATAETIGAFLKGLRIVVIDGTTFDVPDSDINSRVFGRPGTRPGTQAAFPKVRLSTSAQINGEPTTPWNNLGKVGQPSTPTIREAPPTTPKQGCPTLPKSNCPPQICCVPEDYPIRGSPFIAAILLKCPL